jgi:hypothetical protein
MKYITYIPGVLILQLWLSLPGLNKLQGARQTQFVTDKMTFYISIWPNTHTVISIIVLNLAQSTADEAKWNILRNGYVTTALEALNADTQSHSVWIRKTN